MRWQRSEARRGLGSGGEELGGCGEGLGRSCSTGRITVRGEEMSEIRASFISSFGNLPGMSVKWAGLLSIT